MKFVLSYDWVEVYSHLPFFLSSPNHLMIVNLTVYIHSVLFAVGIVCGCEVYIFINLTGSDFLCTFSISYL